jgi:mannose/cellobiose epimerase-like protein (N-acyl-D-glucosamine 2-epimerase family)
VNLRPDFRSPIFLRDHIARTLAFYRPVVEDPEGGFFHYFRDDGTVYDRRHRHLVSSTRFVFNFARAFREWKDPLDLALARHGLEFLRTAHREPDGSYVWTLRDGKPEDRTRHAYGHAFVMLAYATALEAGIGEARDGIEETWALLESRFYDSHHGLYRDEADPGWRFSAYRGQNANMHLCEALIAAHEATGRRIFLDRAARLAFRMTREQAALGGGLIWEHYGPDWTIDWEYNRDHPKDLFRPWGFQVGHQIEWAKLLLILDRLDPAPWRLGRARELFDRAWQLGWDGIHGGLYYGIRPDGTVADDDKYFWVQAEAIAASAHLACATGDARYWEHYESLWDYAWRVFIDHRYGAWYRILTADNRKISDEKSPAGKCDYHTMGACYEVLGLLDPATPVAVEPVQPFG